MEAIKESVAQMSQMFLQKLAEFEDRQRNLGSPSSSASSSLAAEFSSFKTFTLTALRTLQTQVELIAREMDNLEMHARRKILLLHGIPEDKKEDTTAVTVACIVQRLKVSNFKAEDISRCHRMGRSSSTVDRPRPILFKLRDVSVRSKIWAAKTNLKGSGFTLSEFLTKARHNTFMEARRRFGVPKCWSRDGSVFVMTGSGKPIRVSCVAELERLDVQSTVPIISSKPASTATKEPNVIAKSKRTINKK